MNDHRRRAVVAAGVALLILVGLPVAFAPFAMRADAHSGLVAAVPSTDGGSTVRLVFSEPLEARFSGADVVTQQGTKVAGDVGRVDPADSRILVVTLPADPPVGAAIAWRALSGADGHVTTGTIPLPVGEPSPVGARPASRGHNAGHLSAEVIAKILIFGSLLTALGLLPFGRLVVAPVTGRVPRGFAVAQADALLIAGLGAAVLLVITEQELAGAGEAVDPIAYVFGGRIGIVLTLRILVPLLGGLLAVRLVRGDALERASGIASATAAATLVLTASSGHAAAYPSPAPVLVDAVHLGAASVWLGGLIGFAGLIGSPNRPPGDAVRAMVPRFSALALAATAILGLTGLYSAWLTTRDWTTLDSPYGLSLALKVVVVAAAFGIGALNFLDGGRDLRVGGGLDRRVVLEAGVAFVVVVATAQLTSTDPPGLTRPVPVAPVGAEGPVQLALAPARAGPNLLVVTGPIPVGAVVRLQASDPTSSPMTATLGRLDDEAGTAAERARAQPGPHLAATASIPSGTWDVTVALEADGPPVARFAMTLDAAGIAAGRRSPAAPPTFLVAIGLLLLAAGAAMVYALRLRLPNLDATVARPVMAGLALVAATAGVAILASGPPA
jgi:copper transport protein